jgi:Reverse transcriptase (RNA-dependent DNA polymerase)
MVKSRQDTRRSDVTSYTMSNMMVDIRLVSSLLDILLIRIPKAIVAWYKIDSIFSTAQCLEIWGSDVGNAYLEAKTKQKVYIVAGPEFGPMEGHTLFIDEALYGVRSSGLCWHQRFADVLRDIRFTPRKVKAYILMREGDGVYEYIAVYVDDLLISSRNPEEIVQTLQEIQGFKLKSDGQLTYHLGCDYFREKDGTLCYGPKK